MRLAMLALVVMTCPAAAQAVFDTAPGLYGDATDPATSCAANPHRLDFTANPPHVLLTWSAPYTDDAGQTRSRERYDLLDATDSTLTLRLEGETRQTDSGSPPIWVMRMTEQGYCWGREDWPLVRCEHPQTRCEKPIS